MTLDPRLFFWTHIFYLCRNLTLTCFISCRSWPYRWYWFQCLCCVHWRRHETASLFDWRALEKSELLSKGEKNLRDCQYTLRYY